ncbi:MAG: hypothetical protein QW279_05940 [Candidatus Jordarchaeaceae archaeon]
MWYATATRTLRENRSTWLLTGFTGTPVGWSSITVLRFRIDNFYRNTKQNLSLRRLSALDHF